MPEIYESGKQVAYYIYRPHITIKGVTYYARDYGKRVFKIPIYR